MFRHFMAEVYPPGVACQGQNDRVKERRIQAEYRLAILSGRRFPRESGACA